MKLEAKNIGILGLGKSGYWSAKLATSMDYKVFISDSNTNVNSEFINDLKILGSEIEIGMHSEEILKSDLIIKSPGISNDIEIMHKIKASKIPVISEIEFAGNLSKSKNICITGANGLTFDPVNYKGDFKWTNIPDIELNPDGTVGFFRGIMASASKPIKTNFGYSILFRRTSTTLAA